MVMEKPVLVIMAAGMGSRYGGLKQIDPVDGQGHLIIDFSIYDAVMAGFEKVVFIIKKNMEKEFKQKIGDRITRYVKTDYAYQELESLPKGFSVPEGREKPWGTAHAVYCSRERVNGPFAVINADDFYGRKAFRLLYQFLVSHSDDDKYHYAMVGYRLDKTLTDHGHIARGICTVDENGYLADIHERTHIEKRINGIAYTEDGETWVPLSPDTTVSMNLWGFTNGIFTEIESRLAGVLKCMEKENPLKGEYFLPTVVGELLKEGKADIQVLRSADKWYGMTYHEDKETVMKAIEGMRQDGAYPKLLWNGENKKGENVL